MDQAKIAVDECVQALDLKDPGSAQVRNIRIGEKHGQANIHGNIYGWLVTFELNGKNSFGAYVGFRTIEMIMFDDGQKWWCSGYIPQ